MCIITMNFMSKCGKSFKFFERNSARFRLYCTKSSDKDGPPVQKFEHPLSRTLRILKADLKTIKNYIPFIHKQHYENKFFSDHCDIVVIGGGVIGSSIAYWLQTRVRDGVRVIVIEKDPSYAKASTPLSCGGIRQQFSLPENIQMSMFGAEFLRNIKRYLHVEGDNPPDVCFTPYGYLFLATDRSAQQLEENVHLQHQLGVKNELLSPTMLKKKFPWLDTTGIALGCHGLENEGWFDPWSLLMAFKKKAISAGAEYVTAEAIGFEFRKMPDMLIEGVEPGTYETIDRVLVKTENGEVRPIKFGIAVIAAGANSKKVAEMARIGKGSGYLRVPLPIEPRKRYVYCVHCPEGPGLNTPFVIDPTGTYFRREGFGGNFICGKSPTEEEGEPSIEHLEVDSSYFDNSVWPHLAARIPAFEQLKVKSAWAGYYDTNVVDENGIVGPHPYYHNLYLAAGFSGHGIQQAPAVGRAVMEMMFEGGFKTIDLSRFGFDRLMYNELLREVNIV
ncbi:FAD-dependent oxidoreductase domain-containing protein 1-like [Schistocerca piceifrons]|uniref:FAD-dependent oxidoreductase domain-containing protein 1-like n=1 Tax=Schistocerca piceifrons TaxID=274613 RepID=UPI001F5E3B26|nr:FAD-dependent oxidoreductase domain-containing protein 1-like [Schistocerca piceifrons]